MTPSPRRSALLALCAGALLPRAALAQGAENLPEEAKVGQLLQDAPMLGLNGPNRRLSDYRGRPLLINVWASWCAPCRAEMASLERLAWLEHPVPFAVIGISTDDYPDRAQQLLRATNATISHFIDRRLQLETLLGASRLPLTVLVDAQGRVVDKVYGAREWDSPQSQALVRNAFSARSATPRK
ncbi:TlpA disulfide reductase family protein [Piscinibacter sp.]|uniref:TlpA family protein disulfide reductase n=1 Tax=Piscinibacter sp. TaxID=1903157 RepID=UPI001DDFDD5F|nr:TlpA disulfide reductase family protein [Piscinibacter sp.]MBK7531914.1 TlpA family protein disulfide reductase [Piscinibacter sp.]